MARGIGLQGMISCVGKHDDADPFLAWTLSACSAKLVDTLTTCLEVLAAQDYRIALLREADSMRLTGNEELLIHETAASRSDSIGSDTVRGVSGERRDSIGSRIFYRRFDGCRSEAVGAHGRAGFLFEHGRAAGARCLYLRDSRRQTDRAAASHVRDARLHSQRPRRDDGLVRRRCQADL